ncbi:glycosyltransferase [Candidatus Omnitrophota bacterium]
MARILLITYFFPPVNTVGCRRIYSWAKYLTEAGHDVTVVTADTPDVRDAQDFCMEESFLKVYRLAYFDARNLIRKIARKKSSPSISAQKSLGSACIEKGTAVVNRLSERGILLGFTRFPSFSEPWFTHAYKKVEHIIKEKGVDVIISSSPPPTVVRIAAAIKKRHPDIFWIADFRDLWTQHANYRGMFPFSAWENQAEKNALKKADVIITVSEILKKTLEKKFAHKKISVIENGFDFESDVTSHKTDVERIMYFGTLYRTRHDITSLLQAAEELTKRGEAGKIQIEFYGSSITECIVKEQLAHHPAAAKIVKYKGLLSFTSVLEKYKQASALLFIENDEKNDGVLTGKIFEYMAARKPIFCIGVDRGSYVGEFLYKTGVCFFCGRDVNRIKDFMLKLQKNEIIINPNEDFIAQFSHKKQVEKVNKIITSQLSLS